MPVQDKPVESPRSGRIGKADVHHPVEWRESAVESHIRQYPISTMADIVERLRREIEVSGGLTTIRREQLKRVQLNLSQLVSQIDGKGPR